MSDSSQNVAAFDRSTSVKSFLSPLHELLNDDRITEIAVNDPGRVWYERNSVWSYEKFPSFTSIHMQQLGTAVAAFSNQELSRKNPLISADMPDGSRIQFIGEPAVPNGKISMTMMKVSNQNRSLSDYSAQGLFDHVRPVNLGLRAYEIDIKRLLSERNYEGALRAAVAAKLNIVFSGKTGSGKTTFMKAMAKEIPLHERIITIEDVRELHLPHDNVVNLVYSKGGQSAANVTAKDLLECCLRSKPDRILLAEVRGDECLYYVRVAASGHPGSMTSMHGGSPAEAFEQMAIMIQDSKGGANLTFDVIKRLLTLTIDMVIQFQCDDGIRYISEIYYDPDKKLKVSQQ